MNARQRKSDEILTDLCAKVLAICADKVTATDARLAAIEEDVRAAWSEFRKASRKERRNRTPVRQP